MCTVHTQGQAKVCLSCWQRAWWNLTLHFVNYKLFTSVICVWVSANDTLTIGLCVTVLRARLSKHPHPKASLRMSTGVYRKITSTVTQMRVREDFYLRDLGISRRVALESVSSGTGRPLQVDGAWACSYTIQREPHASETLTSGPHRSPNWKSQWKRQDSLYRIRVTQACPCGPHNCGGSCVLFKTLFPLFSTPGPPHLTRQPPPLAGCPACRHLLNV